MCRLVGIAECVEIYAADHPGDNSPLCYHEDFVEVGSKGSFCAMDDIYIRVCHGICILFFFYNKTLYLSDWCKTPTVYDFVNH